MPRRSNQKLKLLWLSKILLDNTDEKHLLNVPQIISKLSQYGIEVERKSIYGDIEALKQYGFDIEIKKGRNGGYYIASRLFEFPEIKILADAVQASKFITSKKSRELLKKLEGFVSVHEAKTLKKQIYWEDRVKSLNENIYYNVDQICMAIDSDKKISFMYFEYNVDKQKIYQNNGRKYEISPFALLWRDEKYYMLGYDEEIKKIKHYRVDKIESIELCEKHRDGVLEFKELDIGEYTKKMFSMLEVEEKNVKLRFPNTMAGLVIDKFGHDVNLIRDGEEYFTVTIKVEVSDLFYGWLFGKGEDAEILWPAEVKKEYADKLHIRMEKHKDT